MHSARMEKTGAHMEETGDRLRGLMDAHPNYRGRGGQSALHRKTDVPQPTIARILANQSRPETVTASKLAAAFEVTCEWLLTGRGPKFIAELGANAPSVSVLHSGIPEETVRETLPIDVIKALQSALTAFRTGADILSSDLRTIIWYALTPVESGNIAQTSSAAASEHERSIVERATSAMKRTGDEHVEPTNKEKPKKRHQS